MAARWLRDRLRSWPAWVDFQRLRREGPANVWRRWRAAPGILKTPAVLTKKAAESSPCEVHVLLWQQDFLMGMWAVKSFYWASKTDWPLHWHQGGSISQNAIHTLLRHFPSSVFHHWTPTDELVEAKLRELGCERLRAARRDAFMFRKFVDPWIVGSSPSMLVFDTDVLFFRKPAEILQWSESGEKRNLFNRDPDSWYTITAADALRRHGIDLVQNVNAGLGLIRRESIVPAALDEFLETPDLMREPWLAEQTAQALSSSRYGVGLLPDTYRVTKSPGLTTSLGEPLTAKHYVSHPRPLFFQEGIPHLRELGFPA